MPTAPEAGQGLPRRGVAESSRPGLLETVCGPSCSVRGWSALNALYQIYNLTGKLPCKNKI